MFGARHKYHAMTVESDSKRQKVESQWFPPSVTHMESPFSYSTSTFHSEIPKAILANKDEPVYLGVDEAGRGPVMGPMVYGISYCLESYLKELKKFGFADSKTLKEDKRQQLFEIIEEHDHELNDNVGWATCTMTAKDILSGMLQSSHGKGAYNLNEQAHDTTIQLIKQVLAKGVNIKHIYVDTVGPPASYQMKLQKEFPNCSITVAKKADSIYPIVSTASVVAKVTRDFNLKYYLQNLEYLQGQSIGSGYPSDPNTSRWLNGNVDKAFGWNFGLIRFLWQTAKDSLVKHGAHDVIYEEDCIKQDSGYVEIDSFFCGNPQTDTLNNDFYGKAVSL